MTNKNMQRTKPKVIYFETKVAAVLEQLAQENAISFNALVKIACREWLQRNVKQFPLSVESPKERGKDDLAIRFANNG